MLRHSAQHVQGRTFITWDHTIFPKINTPSKKLHVDTWSACGHMKMAITLDYLWSSEKQVLLVQFKRKSFFSTLNLKMSFVYTYVCSLEQEDSRILKSCRSAGWGHLFQTQGYMIQSHCLQDQQGGLRRLHSLLRSQGKQHLSKKFTE